jgi:hypothetical protein
MGRRILKLARHLLGATTLAALMLSSAAMAEDGTIKVG